MKFIILSVLLVFTIPFKTNQEGKESAWYKYSEQKEYITKDRSEKKRLFLKINNNRLKGELINSTKKTKKITTEDGSLIMILEAINNQNWEPIEYWAWSDCGNSYSYPLELKRNHKVEFNIPVFQGDIKTKMRLRLCVGDEIIFSDEFIGTVNKEKFVPLKELPYPDLEWTNLYLKNCNSD